jgi:signal transduction histidine kinase/ActR/RegA family two-component response regulator
MRLQRKLQICALAPFLATATVIAGICVQLEKAAQLDMRVTAAELLSDLSLDIKRAVQVHSQSPTKVTTRYVEALEATFEQQRSAWVQSHASSAVLLQEMKRNAGQVSRWAKEFGQEQSDMARNSMETAADGLMASTTMLADTQRSQRATIQRRMLIGSGLALLAVPFGLTIAVLVLSRSVGAGTRTLQEAITTVADGGLDQDIPCVANDEFGELSESLNNMVQSLRASLSDQAGQAKAHRQKAEELKASNQLLESSFNQLKRAQHRIIQQERLHALKQISSGIMRDFNDSLTPILGTAEVMLNHPEECSRPDDVLAHVQTMYESATRLADVIGKLGSFFSPTANRRTSAVDLNDVARKAIELTRPLWKEQMEAIGTTIYVEKKLGPAPRVDANEEDLVEATVNLIINAVEAMRDKGGSIMVITRSAAGKAVLTVTDTGPGMSAESLDHCCEPFFSSDPDKSGMGLTVVSGAVQRYGGKLDIHSDSGVGTTVHITMPASSNSDTSEADAPPDYDSLPPLRILTIDDEPAVSRTVKRALTMWGHQVTAADSGNGGLLAFEQGSYDMVITDLAMADINGDEVARRIKEISPRTPIIMLTGFGQMVSSQANLLDHVDHVLLKPYSNADLKRSLTLVSQKYDVVAQPAGA